MAAQRNGVVVVDFFAVWCPPCRTAAPVFGALSEKYPGAAFVKVDVDECKAVARACNVSSMPTFQVYAHGKLVDQTVGFSAANIEAMLQKHGLQAAQSTNGADKAD
jgi:thioredoxin 1